jgi:hypothetical protein
VLSGFVYWLIACRDREVVADEKLSETLGTFR